MPVNAKLRRGPKPADVVDIRRSTEAAADEHREEQEGRAENASMDCDGERVAISARYD
jgi:hypothetical protein